MRDRLIQYLESDLGIKILAYSAIAIMSATGLFMIFKGWEVSDANRQAGSLALLLFSAVFSVPATIIFNLVCFLVWWVVTAIRER